MPNSRAVADALGVVTIVLVVILFLLGVVCILYTVYFRPRVRGQGFIQLGYFTGPWIIRIAFIVFAVFWGVFEILHLSLLRRGGKILNAFSLTWQQNTCKVYIVANLGITEPCLFLTLAFLLRASLQRSGTLSQKWNRKTFAHVLLFCFPISVLQLLVILIGPHINKHSGIQKRLPDYFTSTAASIKVGADEVAPCTYPLLSTILLGLFATILTIYLFWLGRRILHLVINKGLRRRVYTLIFSVSAFFPLRVLLLGLSVLSKPDHYLFETLAFLAFLSLLCCAGVGIFMLVFLPIADSLALRNPHNDLEARMSSDELNETVSLIANQSPLGESAISSPGRNSTASTKRGSISFRTLDKDGASAPFVELSLFSPSQHSTPPGSPQLLGWPMLPPAQDHGS